MVYVVETGAIEIVRDDGDVDEPVRLVAPGAYFGELGPMMGQVRSATARAVGTTRLSAITVQQFRNRSRSAAADAASSDGD